MADDRTIADPDRNDDTNRSSLNRLNSIVNVLETLHRRIDNINANFSPPPDDDKPGTRTALANLRNEAQAIVTVANEITTKVG